MKMSLWIRQNTRKLIAVVLAPGFATLAFEAYVGHYVGSAKSGGSPYQPVPVWFGLIATVLVLAICLLDRRRFAIGVRVAGVLSFLVGAAGVAFHVWSFVVQLVEQKVMDATGEAFTEAMDSVLGSAPPAFAPGAFVLMGVLLYVLGSRRVLIRVRPPG